MHELVVAAGVDPAKVFRIPIGVDLDALSARRQRRSHARAQRSSAFRSRRSSSARSSRTASGSATGSEPKLVKGPDTLVAVLERLRESDSRALRSAHRACPRLRPRRELERLRHSATATCCSTRATSLARAYHALDVYARRRRGRRAGRRRCSSRWPPASRSSRPASARRRSSSSDGENGLLADVDDVDALAAAVARIHDDAELARTLRERRPADGRGERGRAARPALGRSCSTASSRGRAACGLTARASAATSRAALALGAAARARGRPRRGLRVFYGHDLVPAAGRAGRRRHGEVPAARAHASPTARPTSPCSTSARPGCRATSARCCGSRGGDGSRSSSTRTASPIRAGPARRRTSSTRRYRRALQAADHVLYQSEFSKDSADLFLGEPRGLAGRSSTTPSTSTASRRPPAPPADGPVLLLGGDQTQAYRLELALRTFAASSRSSRTRACSSPAGSSHPRSRCSTSSASATASSSSAATRSATRPTSFAARISCCTRRSRIRARVR